MLQVVRRAFYIVEVWNTVCCHGNKNCKLILQSTFTRTLLFSCLSYLIKIWLSVGRYHLANFHIFKNLNIFGTKRDI